MTNWKVLAALAALVGALLITQSFAQKGDKKKDESAKKDDSAPSVKETSFAPKTATLKIEKKPFKIELALKGALESESPVQIAHHPSPIVGVQYMPGPLTIRK